MKRNTNSRKRETKKYWKYIKRRLIYPDYNNRIANDFFNSMRWSTESFLMKQKKEKEKVNIKAKF